MSKLEMIERQYDYGCWVREKLLRFAGEIDPEQYFGETQFGSLHSLLTQMVLTEWVWWSLAQTGSLPGPPPSAESLPALADVEAFWQEEDSAFQAFYAGLSEDDLMGAVDTVSPAVDAYTFVRWEMVQHMLLHSMQHRTEAAAVLSSYGKSPGDVDLLFFVVGRE